MVAAYLVDLEDELPNDDLAGIAVQLSPHLSISNVEIEQFGTTVQIGWSQPNRRIAMDASRVDDVLYVGFADKNIREASGHSLGVAYSSTDDGDTWYGGEFPEWNFIQGFAQVGDLVADPNLAATAYLAFNSTGQNGELAPPFAYTIDAGHTWHTPENFGIVHGEWSLSHRRHLAAGQQGEVQRVYLTYSAPAQIAYLYYTDDLGDTWNQINIPWQVFVDEVWVDCQPSCANCVAIKNNRYLARSLDRGNTWEVHDLGNLDYSRDFVADKYDPNFRRFWTASGRAAKDILTFVYVDQTVTRHTVVHVWDPNPNMNPRLTAIQLEQSDGDLRHRVIWSGLNRPIGMPSGDYTDRKSVQLFEWIILPDAIEEPMTISESPVYVTGTSTVTSAASLTIQSGVDVVFLPGAKLVIEGTLNAGGSGPPTRFERFLDADSTSAAYNGLLVKGTATMTNCIIEGAETGIETHMADAVSLTNCTIQNCGTGFYAYQPVGYGEPELSGCTITQNTDAGVSLLGTKGAYLDGNTISNNGNGGIVMTNSFAVLSNNRILDNGVSSSTYGLECYTSSPVLYCNEFEDNMGGEMGLFSRSYPVLWTADSTAGRNTFTNDHTTLIRMSDSYPVMANGENNFYLGTSGYFLYDASSKPPKHDISANYWNPTLALSLLYPSSSAYWTWTSTEPTASECGEGGAGLNFAGGPEALFLQGFSAEMMSQSTEAEAAYTNLLSTYPDSTLATSTAARLFELSRQTDTTFADLRQYLLTLAAAHADDTALARVAEALATQSQVEDRHYQPALDAYTAIIANPPSEADSAYAALDYAVTALREQYECGSGRGLDSEAPMIGMSTLSSLRQLIHDAIPEEPPITHEGYVMPPENYVLEQNYPNPFNATTTIRYYMPESGRVRLDIFNIVGQRVASLADGFESGGYHIAKWDGSVVASGVYFYRLDVNGHVMSKKLLLMK